MFVFFLGEITNFVYAIKSDIDSNCSNIGPKLPYPNLNKYFQTEYCTGAGTAYIHRAQMDWQFFWPTFCTILAISPPSHHSLSKSTLYVDCSQNYYFKLKITGTNFSTYFAKKYANS